MNRFKCPACGGNQYTPADTAEGCIYCGNKELKKMETLARRNSMRLIDADKAVEQINEWLDQTGAIPLNTSYHFELLGCIEDCPTIDAVPVVRWKDCKHYNTIGCAKGFGWCENIDRGTSDNFYCANGKQLNKESEDD